MSFCLSVCLLSFHAADTDSIFHWSRCTRFITIGIYNGNILWFLRKKIGYSIPAITDTRIVNGESGQKVVHNKILDRNSSTSKISFSKKMWTIMFNFIPTDKSPYFNIQLLVQPIESLSFVQRYWINELRSDTITQTVLFFANISFR